MTALVKIGKILLEGIFAATALSDFMLKKKFKYVDELVAGDHLATWIGYK